MSTQAFVRVGVGCIVTNRLHPGCILIGTRLSSHGANKLAAPGGHLELGESWEACALREVKEETNLSLKNVKLLAATNDPNIDSNPSKHYITIFMHGDVPHDSPELINLEPHKCTEWIWMPWKELCKRKTESPASIFEPLQHLIDNIASEDPEFLRL